MAMNKYHALFSAAVCAIAILSGGAQADMLCPDTTKLKDLSIGDVTDLQFDIDRLNLCLQRAKLLEELDKTVKEREQIRQQPLGATGKNGANAMGAAGPFSGAIPVIPSMPSLPSEVKAMQQAPAAPLAVVETPVLNRDWKIQRIWGQGSGMQAQLAQGDTIANVKLNDVLPNGEKIVELSARGVVLDDGKSKHSLSWLEPTKKIDRAATDKRS
jgi:hypothetical protein